jgi:hypothetical protein
MIIPGALMLAAGAIVTFAAAGSEHTRTDSLLAGLGLASGGAVLLGLGWFRGYPYVVPGPAPAAPAPVPPAPRPPARDRDYGFSPTGAPSLWGMGTVLNVGVAF